jgi:hypothetical protein
MVISDFQGPGVALCIRELFSGDQVGRWLGGRSLHTIRSVLSRCLWELCLITRLICIIFVADLIACRLKMSSVACRPVTPRLWSGFRVWLL